MSATQSNTEDTPKDAQVPAPKPNKGGLEGIVAATTAISKVEGTVGRLIYRGYNIHDLARNATFEEIMYLLWFDKLPNQTELAQLHSKLATQRIIPESVIAIIRLLPTTTDPMDVLRTAVSAWGGLATSGTPTIDQAIALTAHLPAFLAAFQRLRTGKEPLESRPELGHAANYLYLLTGEEPKEEHVRGLNSYLVLLADHGMNASTFTGRVIASTGSDLSSSVTGAIGALKGPLHGGAPSKVLDMLNAIAQAGNTEAWLRDAITHGGRIMGFGHRVYKTTDPRAEELREMARVADPASFTLSREVEVTAIRLLEEEKPGRKLYTNVEFYSAALLSSVGLPGDLFTPTFAVSRVSGWTAHILEQVNNNRLIRPEADYTGPDQAKFVPINER